MGSSYTLSSRVVSELPRSSRGPVLDVLGRFAVPLSNGVGCRTVYTRPPSSDLPRIGYGNNWAKKGSMIAKLAQPPECEENARFGPCPRQAGFFHSLTS